MAVRLGQVRLGQVRLGQVRLGQVRLGQVRLGQVRLGQVRLGQVRLGQVRLGEGQVRRRLGQVRLGKARLGLVRLGLVGQVRVGQARLGHEHIWQIKSLYILTISIGKQLNSKFYCCKNKNCDIFLTTARQTYTATVSNLSSCNFFCWAITIHTVLVQKVSTNCDLSNRGSTSSPPLTTPFVSSASHFQPKIENKFRICRFGQLLLMSNGIPEM